MLFDLMIGEEEKGIDGSRNTNALYTEVVNPPIVCFIKHEKPSVNPNLAFHASRCFTTFCGQRDDYIAALKIPITSS
jgi:hypothetical protein